MSKRAQPKHDDWYTMDLEDWMVVVNNYNDLVLEHNWYRQRIERAITTLRSQPNDLEDGPDYHRELLSFLDGAICHALDILEGKE